MITKKATSSREEWKALRKKYIGGSDAASVVGLNPFSSPYALWAEKTGKTAGFEGNLATEVGTYLEDFVAKKFEAETGFKVRRSNLSIFNDKYPFAIANIDRDIVGEDAGLECKSTSALALGRFKGGEFPDNYYCQCVHYLAVTEKKRWYLAVLIGNKDFKIYVLSRVEGDIKPEWAQALVYISDGEINTLMGEERKFWDDNVLADVPPAADGSEACTETIKTVYADSDCGDGNAVDLSAYRSELNTYFNTSRNIKELERMRDEAANKIKAFMQNSAKGVCGDYKVSWQSATRRVFDSKAFTKDFGDADKYYKETAVRPFKITLSE